jgi:hypothetical protein
MTEKAPNPADLQKHTLTGDVRDLLTQFIKLHKPGVAFRNLSEIEQLDMINKIAKFADDLVEEAVACAAADGFDSLNATVKSVGGDEKGKIKIVLTTDYTEETWGILGGATGVQLAVVNTRQYHGERRTRVKLVEKQQGEMFGEPEDESVEGTTETEAHDNSEPDADWAAATGVDAPAAAEVAEKVITPGDVTAEGEGEAILANEPDEPPADDGRPLDEGWDEKGPTMAEKAEEPKKRGRRGGKSTAAAPAPEPLPAEEEPFEIV